MKPRRRWPTTTAIVLVVVSGVVRASLTLVTDRLSMDVLVSANAHWWRAEQTGLAKNEFVFEPTVALVGLTGHIGPVVSFRAGGDVGALEPQDLCVDLHWRTGLALHAGQFLLPLGMDAMAAPDHHRLAGNSLLIAYTKPAGTRDIGAMGSWEASRLSVWAAVVGGTGPNAGDNNDRKDLCGRLAVRPLDSPDMVVAARVYCGWPDASDSLWLSSALEARLRIGSLEIQSEFQNHRSRYARNSMTYLQAAWDIGMFEPVGRFDLVLPQGKRTGWMLVGGLNVRPLSDHLEVMLDCSYRRDYQTNWSLFGFHFRLQTAI